MKIPCDVIMDLLPLYYDGVCNENSKRIVEEHLAECASCKSALGKIRNSTVDDFLKKEREDVVSHHAQAVKRKSFVVGVSIASVMAIPILVSMIVNLATGRALDWFFIVLTSLMTTASVSVVPLVFEKEKGLWTLGSFTISLSLLLLTCAIYNGGDWFFLAIIPVLFGLSVLFAPYVINRIPMKGRMAHHKGALAMMMDTILLFVIIVVNGLHWQGYTWLNYWLPALLITPVCSLLPWGLFLIIRYMKGNALMKAGVCVFFSGVFLSVIDIVIDWIIEGVLHFQFRNANLSVWNNDSVINANVFLLTLLTGCIIGGALFIIGLLKKKKKKNETESECDK